MGQGSTPPLNLEEGEALQFVWIGEREIILRGGVSQYAREFALVRVDYYPPQEGLFAPYEPR